MPTTIKLKNSVTTTNAPTSLVQGEVAINVTDKKVWVGNAATTPVLLLGSGADGTFTNLTVSGVASFADGTVSLPSITNIGDTNTGIFFPAADTIAFTEGGVESMRIDSSANIGVGTISPSGKMTISDGSRSINGIGTLNIFSTNTQATDNGGSLAFGGQNGSAGSFDPWSFATLKGAKENSTSGNLAGYFALATANSGGTLTERMRIDSSGNVGIGTSSTGFNASGLPLVIGSGSGNTGMTVYSGNASSGSINFADAVTTGADSYRGIVTYNHTDNYMGLFTNAAERMRIDSSGNLLVGGTALTNSAKVQSFYDGNSKNGFVANDTASATNSGFFVCSLNGTNIGSILRVGATSAVVYNTTSDQRLKSNIADANPVLDKLMDVKVRQYDWTEGNLHQDAGFIAQELAPVLSGVVTQGKTEEDMWQMDYARLTPYLVKAIQEQQAMIETLTTRLNALEGK